MNQPDSSSDQKRSLKPEILVKYEDVYPYLDDVRRLADANREAFGFVPESAYEPLAAKGKLWVAVDRDSHKILGHLLFGGKGLQIKIFQTFVVAPSRRSGVGTEMISLLKTAASERGMQTIVSRVAADLGANIFWEAQGFRLVRQVKGGKSKRRLINERAYEVPNASLWSPEGDGVDREWGWVCTDGPVLETPHYVLDLNVFFDVIRDRIDAEMAREVISASMSNDIRVSVTGEFRKELQRHSFSLDSDPALKFAQSLPTLPEIDEAVLQPTIDELRTILWPQRTTTGRKAANDKSDLTHLASCIHHRVTGFLTQEIAILKAAGELRIRFNLAVLSPAELLNDAQIDDGSTHVVVANTDGHHLEVRNLDESGRQIAESFLLQSGLDDSAVIEILAPGTTARARRRLEFLAGSIHVGVVSWDCPRLIGDEIQAYLVVDDAHPLSLRVIDHAFQAIGQDVPSRKLTRIRLSLPRSSAEARDTAVKRGFQLHEPHNRDNQLAHFIRWVFKGFIFESQWAPFRGELKRVTKADGPETLPRYPEACNTGVVFRLQNREVRTITLFDFETLFAPVFLVCPGRPAVMVPIRGDYASQLLINATDQQLLFPNREALMYLERAYFLSPRTLSLFSRGAVVVFYISGSGRGSQEAVGAARVTFHGKLSPLEAATRLSRQGVLEDSELQAKADEGGKLGAFTFDNYLPFQRKLPQRELKDLGCINGANLVTSQKLSVSQLGKIVSRAFPTAI